MPLLALHSVTQEEKRSLQHCLIPPHSGHGTEGKESHGRASGEKLRQLQYWARELQWNKLAFRFLGLIFSNRDKTTFGAWALQNKPPSGVGINTRHQCTARQEAFYPDGNKLPKKTPTTQNQAPHTDRSAAGTEHVNLFATQSCAEMMVQEKIQAVQRPWKLWRHL